MKKAPLIIGASLLSFGLIGGGVYAYQQLSGGSAIEVQPVAYISTSWWGDVNESDGYVTSDMTQEVMLQDRKVIKEVLVQEGQQVSINDPLLVYDSTLVELELEMQRLTIESLKVNIDSAKRQLQKLNSTQPIAKSEGNPVTTMPVSFTRTRTTEGEQEEVLTYATALTPLEDGTYSLEVKASAKLNVSFLYRLKGLDEVGQTQISQPIQLSLTLLSDDGSQPMIKVLDGSSLEIPAEFIEITVSDYFKESIPDEPEQNQPDHEEKPDQKPEEEPEQPTCPEQPVCPEQPIYPDQEPEEEPDISPDLPDLPQEGYTKEELAQLIQEKKTEIQTLELDYKEALLKEEKIKKEIENLTVRSSVNGVVKKVGDPSVGSIEGSAFIVVSSDSGLYLKGTLTEYQLNEVEPGQMVEVMSWDTGNSYIASITEIYPYPVDDPYSYGNQNVSKYPFVAYIEDATDLKNNMSVSVRVQENVENSNALYLDMAYIGDENGRKFVYKVDEDFRLKKEYIQTGKVIYGSYMEILSGVNEDDQVAFPYTKNIKDGVKAKEMTNMWGY